MWIIVCTCVHETFASCGSITLSLWTVVGSAFSTADEDHCTNIGTHTCCTHNHIVIAIVQRMDWVPAKTRPDIAVTESDVTQCVRTSSLMVMLDAANDALGANSAYATFLCTINCMSFYDNCVQVCWLVCVFDD